MRKNLKRLTSMALALILSASAFPVTAFAASDSTSTLAEVTAKFIDTENGKEIIQPETYSVTHEEKSPQEIENYTYVDYTESVEYVYSHKDLTYNIQSHGQCGYVQPDDLQHRGCRGRERHRQGQRRQ